MPPLIFKVVGRTIVLVAVILASLSFSILSSSRNAVSAGDSKGKAAETTSAKTVDESQYIGTDTCRKCHEKQYQKLKDTKMGMVMFFNPRNSIEARGCEACHGPGRFHSENGGDLNHIIRFAKNTDKSTLAKKTEEDQCLQCHDKGNRLFWEGSAHESRGLTCTNCHQVMSPAVASDRFVEPLTDTREFRKTTKMEVCFQCHQMRRAQLMRSSHMPFREGKVTCTDCHNPHGTANPKLLVASSVNETCYKCHAERRGPFLWEHPPVMENCDNCHEPHGSSNPQMLKVRTPRLCQRCHVASRHPSTPQLATTRFVFNRGCTNCHSQIHGSNSPSGVRFHR